MEVNRLIMLAKVNRLKKKKDIEKVFEKGKGFKEDFLILKIVKNDLENSRFAFVVPRKISKKATLRNKIKRRLRELVRLKIKKIKKGMDLVLLALPGLEKKDFWQMEKIINRLFAKAKLYINGNNN
jgi:ribonuclease P protein component